MPDLTRPGGATACVIDAGLCTLNVSWVGAPSHRAALVIDERMRPFVGDRPGSDDRVVVSCALEAAGEDWVRYDDERGAREPVATRTADGWRATWCYYDLELHGTSARCRFADRAAGLEHALRGAAVFATMPARGLWFHAATLVKDGEAVLFAGHPNAGKSTISAEGGADAVLSNEISALRKIDGRWWAVPTPFWGTGDVARRGEPAPLASVAILEHGRDATRWAPLRGAEAIAAVSPHVGVQARAQWDRALLDALQDLTLSVPCYRMRWLRGTDPFEVRPWKP